MGADMMFLSQSDRPYYEAVPYTYNGEERVRIYKCSRYFPETNKEVWCGPLTEDIASLLTALGVEL